MVVRRGDVNTRMVKPVPGLHLFDLQRRAAFQDLRQQALVVRRNMHDDGDGRLKFPGRLPRIRDRAASPPTEVAMAITHLAESGRAVWREDIDQKRPVNIMMRSTTKTRPRIPLGKYPQLRLCGHEGSAPTNMRISITSRMVPIGMVLFFYHISQRTSGNWCPVFTDVVRFGGRRNIAQAHPIAMG